MTWWRVIFTKTRKAAFSQQARKSDKKKVNPMSDNTYTSARLCNSDGAFPVPPVLTFDFPHRMEGTIPGVTITWSPTYGEWATRYRVRAWDGGTEIFSQTASNGSLVSVLSADVTGYTRLGIEVLADRKSVV